MEVWANNWSFRLSVAKTQVMFHKREKSTRVLLKLYKQELEQVSVQLNISVYGCNLD